ncbi:unnamed protein product [Caretta caretta]
MHLQGSQRSTTTASNFWLRCNAADLSGVIPASAKPGMEHIKVVQINGKEYLGWEDTGAQISVVKQSIIQEGDKLLGQMADLLLAGGFRILVLLAKVHIETEGLEIELWVDVVDDNSIDMLIGNVAQAVKVFTHSKKEYYAGTHEEKGKVPGIAKGMEQSLFNSSAAGGSSMLLGVGVVETSSCTAAEGNTISVRDGGVGSVNEKTVQVVSCEPSTDGEIPL